MKIATTAWMHTGKGCVAVTSTLQTNTAELVFV